MKRLKANLLVCSLLLLSAASVFAAGAEAGQGNPMLDFMWKIVNFALLLGIIIFFAKKPVGAALQSSAVSAKEELEKARVAKEEAKAELNRFQTKLTEMQKEADQMLAAAKVQAEEEKQRIVAEGHDLAEKMKTQAKFSVQQEFKKAESELKRWLAEQVTEAAKQQLTEKLGSTSADDVFQPYLKDLEGAGGLK